MQMSTNKQLEKLKLTLLCKKHLILYKIHKKKSKQLDTVCLHLVTLLFIYKNCIHTHLLINPLKCSSDISELSSPGSSFQIFVAV
jgi:hypothetical protein